ncbi:MAG: NADPH:quinone oxidoreductase family protein [Acidimicrobiia bacterium]
MKAQVVHELGGVESLRYEETADPVTGPSEVRIGVEAVGINFPDLLVIQGLYQFRPDLPFSPGAEAAGTVLEVGGEVSAVAPGDRVIGFSSHGAMAEQFVVPEANTFRIPDALTWEKAAAVAMTYGTSYHALADRARLRAGETLLVTGAAGGVGTAAVQLGKAMGARVIAAVGTDAKAELVRSLGADEAIVYSSEPMKDRVRELTGGRGADVIYEPVGGDVFLETLRCVAWEGRILVVGFASGTIPQAPMNLPLLKGCSIVGVFWGDFARRDPAANRANFDQIFRMAVEGSIDPHVSMTFPLERAGDALSALAERTATGKVVLVK